jgi:zinc protease
MTREDLYNHYRKFYVPNNAIIAVAGDFETQSMLARIRELFEPVPGGPDPARLARPEPPQNGEVRLTVEGPGATSYVQVCYRFPPASHPDFFPFAVLDSLLAGPSNLNMFSGGISNKTSRLYRALVDKEYVVSVHGGAQATIDPFMYTITMTVHPKRHAEESLAALDREIQRIKDEKVTKEEITRAIKQARALFAYGTDNITNQAFWLGYAEMFAEYSWFQTYLDRLSAVTAKDIQRVANEYFKSQHRVVGTYVPLEGKA